MSESVTSAPTFDQNFDNEKMILSYKKNSNKVYMR